MQTGSCTRPRTWGRRASCATRDVLGPEMVRSTERVVEACIEADVPLCAFSSAEVYGRSGQLGEKDDIRVPTGYNARIEYAIAKTLIEAMVVNSLHRGLRGILIRPVQRRRASPVPGRAVS